MTNETVKGLVVEEHQDRIVVSTVDGEQVFMRKDISTIDYDNLEYNLLSMGRDMEAKKKLPEALAYYEKALEINPQLTEAQQASVGIKSKLWAKMTEEGPINEVAKQQEIQDSWRANVNVDQLAKDKTVSDEKLLWERLGIKLAEKGDWIAAGSVRIGGPAYKYGLRQWDELSAIDGKSLRFLSKDIVMNSLLEPRYSNATLQYQRTIRLVKAQGRRTLKDFGLTVSLEYAGLTVTRVRVKGADEASPFNAGDLIVLIGKQLTRYMPLKEAVRIIEDPKNIELSLKINRSVTITRK